MGTGVYSSPEFKAASAAPAVPGRAEQCEGALSPFPHHEVLL